MLEEKITQLKLTLMEMTSLAEDMIRKAVQGFIKKDKDLLLEIIEKQEPIMNKFEIKIDKKCTNIFALYQPEAKDLRIVFMISRMNINLEKIGDHCVNIVESALYLMEKAPIRYFADVKEIAEKTIKMLTDSINSFVNEDTELAVNVCERDTEVDKLNEKIFKELLTYMIANPNAIERSLNLLRIANNFEKIADLTTNIAEETVYVVTGKPIKHHGLKKK
ncbi:MAG: phosphate signaling complex protein PhoU [Spirochaetes bacterium]|nr:phosphate signaling complex protein PhoU [Spirochaetota bacterium]